MRRAPRLGLVAALALAALAGCKSQPGAVDLTIVADGSLSDAAVAGIATLDITVGGVASAARSYPLGHPFAAARQERLTIRTGLSSGTLDISVVARAADGSPVASGQTQVMLRPSAVAARVVLSGGGTPPPDDLGMPTDGGVPPADGSAPPDLAAGSDGGVIVPALSLLAGQIGGDGFADGSGKAARFRKPRGAVFVGGSLYVADMYNDVIRKVVVATGAVTTFAGAPNQTGSTDGTGAAARFNRPHGITTDGAGNLYVADMDNDTIRKIVIATGAVTTFAGSPGNAGSVNDVGTAARFDHPHGLACDGTNLFVADTYNHTIRKIVLADATVSTLAGSSGSRGSADGPGANARFDSPHGLAYDNGNLYVADSGNDEIRQIVVNTRAVTTLAGGFNTPRGVVADGAGNLYVADTDNDELKKVSEATGQVTAFAGSNYGTADGSGAAAQFEGPMGLAWDGANTLFVVDGWGSSIRAVTLAGAVTTLAGLGESHGANDGTGAAAWFRRPHALCVVGANVYVADKKNHVIRRVELATGKTTTLAGSATATGNVDGVGSAARFDEPFGLASDGADTLFVADGRTHTIRSIDLTTANVTTLAGSAGTRGSSDGTGSAAHFDTPAGLAWGAGTLYVADMNNHTIRAIDVQSQVVTTLAGSVDNAGSADGMGTAAHFNKPNGLALDGGALYVADQANSTIRKIDLASKQVTTLAGTAGMFGSADGIGKAARFDYPHALVADGAGHLFCGDTHNDTIREIVIATGAVTTFAGVADLGAVRPGPLPAAINTPTGVAVAADGTLLVATAHENAILQIK